MTHQYASEAYKQSGCQLIYFGLSLLACVLAIGCIVAVIRALRQDGGCATDDGLFERPVRREILQRLAATSLGTAVCSSAWHARSHILHAFTNAFDRPLTLSEIANHQSGVGHYFGIVELSAQLDWLLENRYVVIAPPEGIYRRYWLTQVGQTAYQYELEDTASQVGRGLKQLPVATSRNRQAPI